MPFPLNVGNRMSTPSIELASGFPSKGFKGGIPSGVLVAVPVLSVLVVVSRDETLYLTSGDIAGVM